MARRRDPYSWISVRLPERDLGETVLDFASPLLAELGHAPSIDDERRVLELAISFWNASVDASKFWNRPRPKRLKELKMRLRGPQAPPEGAAAFDLLSARWKPHAADPRLVESWSYESDQAGARKLSCTVGLPEGVRAEVPPPIEKRIAIGGPYLDQVKIRRAGADLSFLSFPVERHRAVVSEDGTATVDAMMPAALQLFAEGRLERVGGPAVEVTIGGRALGPMVLTEVRCAGERYEVAILVFKPASSSGAPGSSS